MTRPNTDESIVESVLRALSTTGSEAMINHVTLQRDLDELNKMLISFNKLIERSKNQTLPIYELQAINAAIVMLQEAMVAKTRDVNRRKRGS